MINGQRGGVRIHLVGAMVAAALVATGCASAGSGGSGGGSRNVITRAEIVESNATTAYEVVRLLRPGFLQSRGARSMSGDASNGPVLYVDGVYRGDVREMELINATSVLEIRYLDGPDATTRFGTGHGAGAIMVKTRSE